MPSAPIAGAKGQFKRSDVAANATTAVRGFPDRGRVLHRSRSTGDDRRLLTVAGTSPFRKETIQTPVRVRTGTTRINPAAPWSRRLGPG
jgi:hypothetical protein